MRELPFQGRRFPLSFDFRRDAQALHAIAQRVAADLQLLGGPREIVAILLQVLMMSCVSKSAMKSSSDAPARHCRARQLCAARFDMEVGQAARLDFAGGFQNHRAFDDVAQFAHVARPMMGQQLLLGARV